MMLKSAKQQKLSNSVLGLLKNYFVDKSLKPGDRLPTEQELSTMFGVSRNSIREATKALCFLGIIESAPRRGLSVGQIDLGRVAEYVNLHLAIGGYPKKLLFQSRVIIEVGSLPYLITAISKNPEIAKKLDVLSLDVDSERDKELYIHKDSKFHSALVAAAGIPPLIIFNDLLQAFFLNFRRDIVSVKGDIEKGFCPHRKVFEALCEGKIESAENELRKHLEVYEKTL